MNIKETNRRTITIFYYNKKVTNYSTSNKVVCSLHKLSLVWYFWYEIKIRKTRKSEIIQIFQNNKIIGRWYLNQIVMIFMQQQEDTFTLFGVLLPLNVSEVTAAFLVFFFSLWWFTFSFILRSFYISLSSLSRLQWEPPARVL